MNRQQYAEFIKAKDEVETLARQYAEEWNKVFGSARGFKEVTFDADTVSIKWYWHGSWGAEDSGWVEVPAEVLLNRSVWNEFITLEKQRQDQREAEAKKEKAARDLREEVDRARQTLERAGFQITLAKDIAKGE